MKIFMGNRVLAAGRDGEQEPFDMSLAVEGMVQIVTGVRADHARPLDRGNRSTLLRFSVLRRHCSTLAAAEFLLVHGIGLVGLDGTVTIAVADGQTYELSSAVLKKVQGTQDGGSTIHCYEIVGGSIAAPTSQEN
ncbi:MAG: hypothetical protein LBP65_01455 [Puniceicoccales bacterium]|jgi:hypothetical protein|nr:hypothetical protein [Puniceicoccales bacterium]